MPPGNKVSDNHDNRSTGNSSTPSGIISDSQYNEADIILAPERVLQQLGEIDPNFMDRLETVPVVSEAPWDTEGEILLRCWMDEAEECANAHKTTGYKLKRNYRILSILVILAAGLVFLVTSLFPCDDAYKVVQVVVSFLNLMVANFASFFDFGPKYQNHFQYEGLYRKFAIDISEILVTREDFRPPKDRTMVEYKERKGNLVTAAPET
jgi:hypothetical protein